MVFSDTSTKLGLIQDLEIKVFGDNGYGRISGNSDLLYQFTGRINRAQDRFTFLAMTADGRWQYDDTNYTDYGIATTNIVSGQRDYTFALEHLEIEKVLIKDTSGNWKLIYSIDQDDKDAVTYLENNSSNTGTPTRYDKRSNSIFLDVTPNYNSTSGLKIYFKRGPSYFVYTDTTKVPGFASIFHGYLSQHAYYTYAMDRVLTNIDRIERDTLKMEASITEFFSRRNKDERKALKARNESTR